MSAALYESHRVRSIKENLSREVEIENLRGEAQSHVQMDIPLTKLVNRTWLDLHAANHTFRRYRCSNMSRIRSYYSRLISATRVATAVYEH